MTSSDPRAARAIQARASLVPTPVQFAVVDTPVRPAPWLADAGLQSVRPLFGGDDDGDEMLSPEEQPEAHLDAMESLFGTLSQENFRKFLKQARSVADVATLLEEADANPPAR